jgi:hypothetical protein
MVERALERLQKVHLPVEGRPKSRKSAVGFQTQQLLDQLFLTTFVLSGTEQVMGHPAAGDEGFLLDPGGSDYVGVNSYDQR